MKSISVFGLGYVGAVSAACLAHAGHRVIGVDLNLLKLEILQSGKAPVLEPGLDRLIAESCESGRLSATIDPLEAVAESELSLICVGTPSLHNGRLDLTSVKHSCEQIGRALRFKQEFHWVVLRSTMLPGTAKSTVIPALEGASGKRAGIDFAVCVNPEFTREGSAVADFLNPSITVLGADDPDHLAPLRDLYEGISGQVFETSLSAAEMVKYACNAFHALKVAFANEIGSFCNEMQVDVEAITRIFLSDTRLNISPAYLRPGFAFGGSCLPKDLRALTYRAKEVDVDLPLLRAILPSNEAHLERAVQAVLSTRSKKIGVIGLSFKSGTDDLRESPLVHLIKRLLAEGREVRIWDRDVSLGTLVGSNRQYIKDEIPHIGALLSTDLGQVVRSSDAIVIGTNSLDEETLTENLRPDHLVIDLRSIVSTPAAADVSRHSMAAA
jgi:GDP-mannose 6-dehydrogenase